MSRYKHCILIKCNISASHEKFTFSNHSQFLFVLFSDKNIPTKPLYYFHHLKYFCNLENNRDRHHRLTCSQIPYYSYLVIETHILFRANATIFADLDPVQFMHTNRTPHTWMQMRGTVRTHQTELPTEVKSPDVPGMPWMCIHATSYGFKCTAGTNLFYMSHLLPVKVPTTWLIWWITANSIPHGVIA